MTNFGEVQYQQHEFIVIGAGVSGLQTGILLGQNNKDFIILEATNKIGGRIGTDKLCDVLQQELKDPKLFPGWLSNNKRALNTPIQYGATWISEEHSFMLRMLKQFKIRLFPQYYDGLSIYGQQEGKYEAVKSLNQHFKNYEVQIQQLLNKIDKIKEQFSQINALGTDMRISRERRTQFINTYDSISVLDFVLQQLNNDPFAYEIVNQIQTLQCIGGDKLSMMQLIYDDNSLDLLKFYIGNIQNTIDGMRVESGMLSVPTQMFNQMLKQVQVHQPQKEQGQIIRMNSPVVKIENEEGNQIKIYMKDSNKIYTCKKVFFSVPIAVIKQIQITKISPAKKLIFDNQEKGVVHRIYFVFENAFWRKKFSGYGSFGNSFPFNEITDLSPANLACGVLAFIFVGDRHQKWNSLVPDPEKRLEYLKGVLADIFLEGDKNSQYLKTCFSYMRTFSTNPYIQAGYQATTKKEIWKQVNETGEDYIKSYEKDENDLIYIGSEFAQEFPTYMEGAVRISRQKTHQILGLQDPWRS